LSQTQILIVEENFTKLGRLDFFGPGTSMTPILKMGMPKSAKNPTCASGDWAFVDSGARSGIVCQI
jgi:hypothetical protein